MRDTDLLAIGIESHSLCIGRSMRSKSHPRNSAVAQTMVVTEYDSALNIIQAFLNMGVDLVKWL